MNQEFKKSLAASFKLPILTLLVYLIGLYYLWSLSLAGQFSLYLLGIFVVWIMILVRSMAIWSSSTFTLKYDRISIREQHSLFNFDLLDLPYNRITAVSASKKSLLHNLLDHGDITINITGQQAPVIISHLPHPIKIKKLIEQKIFIEDK